MKRSSYLTENTQLHNIQARLLMVEGRVGIVVLRVVWNAQVHCVGLTAEQFAAKAGGLCKRQ
jgi:hypothetical protein